MESRGKRTKLTNKARYFLVVAVVSVIGLLLLTGCREILSDDSANATSTQPASSPTAIARPSGAGSPSSLEASIAFIRPAGNPDEIRGSAVVMDSDGFLVTSSDLISGDIEVVLPAGQVHRPALVSIEPNTGLALLKVPAERLVPARFSTARMSEGAEVYASGHDGSPGSIGRMGGNVTGIIDDTGDVDLRVRGPMLIDTDISLVGGFVGGALSDQDNGFSGILIPAEDDEGQSVLRAVSNWYVLAWLDDRGNRRDLLAEEARVWETINLPGDWQIRHPDGWSLDVGTDEKNAFRAELMPGDPDVNLQFSLSVEPNDYGTDPREFIQDQFEDRSGARIWGITDIEGHSLVRVTVSQEGALVDLAYLLNSDYLIAISLTSGYQPEDDPTRTDQARALFEAFLSTLSQ